MKLKCIFSLILILMILVLGSCGTQNNNNNPYDPFEGMEAVDVIVLAGQSNMEGHSWVAKLLENTSSSMHEYYNNGFDNTYIAYHCNRGTNKSDYFENVKAGQGYGKGSFGPEVGIAEELMNRNFERPVYIIKYALGATSLDGDWNVDNSQSLYYEMIDFITEQFVYLEEAEGFRPVIRGFFWMQGEADGCVGSMMNKYYENLEKLVSAFREEFEEVYGDPDKGIAFVDAGISDCYHWQYQVQINAAKKRFAESNPNKNYYFDTMENGLEYDKDNDDIYHFDATSEIKLGKLFISTLLDNGWM